MVGDRIDLPYNPERTHIPVCQLAALHPQWEVPSGHTDCLAWVEHGRWCVLSVGLNLLLPVCPQ